MSSVQNSVKEMWCNYLSDLRLSDQSLLTEIPARHFCDNQKDADECAEFVLRGKKRATSPSVWELEIQGLDIPQKGDLNIVTDWIGSAQCIIQTKDVELLKFREITSEYAALEGEGDGSLAYWRRTHWEYYKRIFAGTPYEVHKDMPIVFELFEVVYPKNKSD
jgi:uncharacterized protein YhfF